MYVEWNRLTVELFTHAKQGITANDFIMAAKIDTIDTTGLLAGKKKKLEEA